MKKFLLLLAVSAVAAFSGAYLSVARMNPCIVVPSLMSSDAIWRELVPLNEVPT